MKIKKAIEHTKNKKGFKVSITGISTRISKSTGSLRKEQKYMMGEFGKHFLQAREGWLDGDLEIVAEFFGLYV